MSLRKVTKPPKSLKSEAKIQNSRVWSPVFWVKARYPSYQTTKAMLRKLLFWSKYFLLDINLFWPLLHKSSIVIHHKPFDSIVEALNRLKQPENFTFWDFTNCFICSRKKNNTCIGILIITTDFIKALTQLWEFSSDWSYQTVNAGKKYALCVCWLWQYGLWSFSRGGV